MESPCDHRATWPELAGIHFPGHALAHVVLPSCSEPPLS